jgi:predicted RNase H-like HicB family nuclease
MNVQFVQSEYIDQAMAQAEYDKLDDGTFSGRIAVCSGVIAFGATLRECEDELRSTLEEWLWLGLKLGNQLPVIGGIDLNREPACKRREFWLEASQSSLDKVWNNAEDAVYEKLHEV